MKAYELGIMLYTIKIAPHIDVKSLKGVKAPSLPKILSEKHGNPK